MKIEEEVFVEILICRLRWIDVELERKESFFISFLESFSYENDRLLLLNGVRDHRAIFSGFI